MTTPAPGAADGAVSGPAPSAAPTPEPVAVAPAGTTAVEFIPPTSEEVADGRREPADEYDARTGRTLTPPTT